MAVSFDGPIPDLARVPGVSAVRANGHDVNLEVNGSVEPLLKVLAGYHVTKLLSREPSLEELFIALYGEQDPVDDHSVVG